MRGFLKVLLIVGAVLGVAIGAFLWLIDTNTPKRNRYLIPEGYAGWLCVTYSVSGKPSLPIEEGFRLVQFDQNGEVQTSDDGMPGKLKDEFLMFSTRGRRPMDYAREMGVGFTISEPPLDAKRYTFMFWVSLNAKVEQPKYNSDTPYQCGPAKAARRLG